MKSIFALSLFCISLGITAQESSNDSPDIPRVEFGFRFMPTVSAFKTQTSDGGTVQGQATFGYGIGGVLGINFTNHVGIQGEIIYNSLSQKYKDAEMERTIHVSYVNIPLLMSFNTGKSKPVNLNFVAGPQIAYNVGSRLETSGGNGTDTTQATLLLRKGDIGFAYGAGLEFCLNEKRTIRLDIGFRGVYGFLKMAEEPEQTGTSSRYNVMGDNTVKTYSAYTGISFLF